MSKKTQTDIWQKFERSKRYVESKGILGKTEMNWHFFIGNQWRGIKTGGEKLPIFNFIKPIVQYKVSTVAQNSMTALYSDMMVRDELKGVYESLNKFWAQCWEKSKMEQTAWRMLKAAAIQGDSYVYWADGDTLRQPQVLANTSLFLADENIDNIQEQEYIIVHERWNLSSAKKVAEENGVSKEEIKKIKPDNSTENQLYNKLEVDEKVTVLLYMTKEDGVVKVCRSTEEVIIEPLDSKIRRNGKGETLGKLTVYPIIPYVWENVPNSARGIGEVEQLIPNQLELNKNSARRSMAVKLGAYPRLAYDANSITNPEELSNVGAPIAINGGSAQSINQMISYLNPANISSDSDKLSADLLQITKDLAGASDYALGNVNPEQASGTAIIAVRDQAQVPLTEQVARYRQWVEDVSLLWADLWMVYNKKGIEFEWEDEYGEKHKEKIGQEELQALKPTVRIDVSPDNQWTKLAEQKSLDAMLQTKEITLEEFAELIPENSSIPKQKLLHLIAKRKAQMEKEQQKIAMQEGGMPPNEEGTDEIDPKMVYQELINSGVPEEEAESMVQSML